MACQAKHLPDCVGFGNPSLETWHQAQSSVYRLFIVAKRAHLHAQPPQVEIVNVSRVQLDNGFSPLALQLLKANYQQGECRWCI